jgi:hypothetical protein
LFPPCDVGDHLVMGKELAAPDRALALAQGI